VHRLPSHVKIVAAFAFVIVVVATPVSNRWAFAAFFVLILAISRVAQIPLRTVLVRATVEIPFVLFAVLMPFFGSGERVDVGPLSLYRDGLEAGAGIVAKGTLGVLTAIVLSSSTQARELLRGFERLRMPQLMVQIISFMLRYVNVVGDEMNRMRIARASRGFEATGPRAWSALAKTAGALFIRCYERGERVHLAMLSRGYEGRLPNSHTHPASAGAWARAMSLPVVAAVLATLAAVVATGVGS